jgi:hypothetical protein
MSELVESLVMTAVVSTVCAAGIQAWLGRAAERRIAGLEQDLRMVADALTQLADVHEKSHRKLSETTAALESRVLEMSSPEAHEQPIPLERRHRVLALARNGMSVDEIVARLGTPRGEVELIVNLKKYADTSRVAAR